MVEFLTNNIFIYICLQIKCFKLAYKVTKANTVFFVFKYETTSNKTYPRTWIKMLGS